MKAFPQDKWKKRNYSIGGPQPPDLDRYLENEREGVCEAYKKKGKAFNDQQQKKREKLARLEDEGSGDMNASSEYKRCNLDWLRTIDKVEANPLMVKHTFLLRDIMYLRVAEEANLRSIIIRINRSDNQQFVATGIDFYV